MAEQRGLVERSHTLHVEWPDKVDCRAVYEAWRMHSFEPEVVAHTIASDQDHLPNGHTETWPVSYSFQIDVEEQGEEAHEKQVSEVAQFLK